MTPAIDLYWLPFGAEGRSVRLNGRAFEALGSHVDVQAILDGLPAMIGYWDHQLHNVMANEAYVAYFGRSPEQIRGTHISELLGPDLYARNLPYIRRALAGEEQLFDRRILGPNGRVRYTQASYVPDKVDGRVRGFSVLVTDITARREAEQRLGLAERRFRALFESAPIGTFLASAPGWIIDANPAAVTLLGRPRERLIGRSLIELTHPGDVEKSRQLREDLVAGRIDSYRVEKRYLAEDGREIWAQLDSRLLVVGDDEEIQILAQVQDISERRRQRAELELLAINDPLTGLLNRRGLYQTLERECARVERHEAHAALLIIDLDRFKVINDTYGHQAGDDVLIKVAELLRSRLRADDVAARHGGDEFAAILVEASVDKATSVAADLRTLIEEARLGLADRPMSASIGTTALTTNDTAADALARADRAMYAAKRRRSTISRTTPA